MTRAQMINHLLQLARSRGTDGLSANVIIRKMIIQPTETPCYEDAKAAILAAPLYQNALEAHRSAKR